MLTSSMSSYWDAWQSCKLEGSLRKLRVFISMLAVAEFAIDIFRPCLGNLCLWLLTQVGASVPRQLGVGSGLV